jgi:hypothetical protein
MGKTPLGAHGDTGPEFEIRLENDTTDPTDLGAIRLVNGSFRFRDGAGAFDPRTGGSGISTQSLLSVAGTLVYVGDGDIVEKT